LLVIPQEINKKETMIKEINLDNRIMVRRKKAYKDNETPVEMVTFAPY